MSGFSRTWSVSTPVERHDHESTKTVPPRNCVRRRRAGNSVRSAAAADSSRQDESQSFRFRTAVELINVTVTVTDGTGRFVSGLRREDFRIFEDGVEQPVSHFSNDRVPVSLGIALDTSGSMDGDKMRAARTALNRFLFDLLDRTDEVFLYRFDSNPELVEGLDDRPSPREQRARANQAEGRHGDVRRRCRSGTDGAIGRRTARRLCS